MVVRRRVRMVLLPLGLWTLSALVVGFFVWQAESGNRGLEAKKVLKIRAYGLTQELAAVRAERALMAWPPVVPASGAARFWHG